MSAPLLDHDRILETVRQWPRDAQLALARELLRAAAVPSEYDELVEAPAPGTSWRNLIGMLATNQPPPSDEEIERWREERRIEKYESLPRRLRATAAGPNGAGSGAPVPR